MNIAVAFFITHYLFEMNSRAIFFGWDPQSLLAFVQERRSFSTVLFGLGSDPVIGLGNISYALNPLWFPSFALSTTGSGQINGPFAFAIGATELFAATLLCGRLNGFGLGPSLIGSWILTLVTWPLFGLPAIVTIWFFSPAHAEILAVSTIMVTATLHLGGGPIRRSIKSAVVIFLCATYILAALPTSLVLVLPVVAIFTGARLVLSIRLRERLTILLAWLGLGVTALMLGYVHYFAGLISYTAAGQFPDLAKRPLTLYGGEVSLLLSTPISTLSAAAVFSSERILVGGGFLGSFLIIWTGSPRQRRLALGTCLAEICLLAIGASNYWLGFWFGPSISYFEMQLFPYFVLCLPSLLLVPLIVVWRYAAYWVPVMARCGRPIRYAKAVVALALPLAVWSKSWAVGPAAKMENERSDGFRIASPYPQPETAITRILKQEIGLIPDQSFRGRVAVMVGNILPEERMWQRYSLVHYFAQLATGNLHDGPGLWQDSVPTLMEYNELVSPPHFAFLRTFLSYPGDIQYRNIIGTRLIDLRILKALGVRFVITDLPISDATLRAQLPVPVTAEARRLLGFADRNLQGFDLFLYELQSSNLGQFSPRRTKLAGTADEALTALWDNSLNLEQTAIVFDSVPERLTPAKLDSFAIGQDEYRIRATSTGTSILILPIEFSRCFTITDVSGGKPRLFRADLLLTGVLFSDRINAQISFHTGPFRNSRCRLDDLADSKRMDIRNAFQSRPELGKLGLR
jgi:hypothetical protein